MCSTLDICKRHWGHRHIGESFMSVHACFHSHTSFCRRAHWTWDIQSSLQLSSWVIVWQFWSDLRPDFKLTSLHHFARKIFLLNQTKFRQHRRNVFFCSGISRLCLCCFGLLNTTAGQCVFQTTDSINTWSVNTTNMEPCLGYLLANGKDLSLCCYHLSTLHNPHWFLFFFVFLGGREWRRVLLTLTRSYLCSHKFLNVHIWINEEVQVRLNDQTSVPGSVSWFSKAQFSSGSHGTGEYPSMHWGAGVHSVDKTNITELSHVHTGCAELKNRR